MTQQEFDFERPAPPPRNTRSEPARCDICGRNYFYTEYVLKDGTLDTEQNRRHESWARYCSRACFVRGIYRNWHTKPFFAGIVKINEITADELAEAENRENAENNAEK